MCTTPRRTLGHAFWPGAARLIHASALAPRQLAGHRQITDAHLIALCDANGGRLATFDRRLVTLGGDQSALAEVVPVI